MPYKFLNLQLFAEDEGTSAESGELAASNVAENSIETSEDQAAPEEETINEGNEESFDDLIAGKYKKDYEAKVKAAVSKRFKNQKDLQSKIDSIDPIVKMVAQKYGIEPNPDGSLSIQAINDAMQNDNSLYEQEAFKRGISVDELKNIKRLERENASLRAENTRTAEQREWDALLMQGEELKNTYPDFDMETEMQNPQFGRLLATMQKSGFPNALQTAYEAVHRDDIMGGAMRYAVSQTESKISKSIQSGMRRPAENGTNQQAAARTTTDPSKLTKSQIDDLKRRAERGERITF